MGGDPVLALPIGSSCPTIYMLQWASNSRLACHPDIQRIINLVEVSLKLPPLWRFIQPFMSPGSSWWRRAPSTASACLPRWQGHGLYSQTPASGTSAGLAVSGGRGRVRDGGQVLVADKIYFGSQWLQTATSWDGNGRSYKANSLGCHLGREPSRTGIEGSERRTRRSTSDSVDPAMGENGCDQGGVHSQSTPTRCWGWPNERAPGVGNGDTRCSLRGRNGLFRATIILGVIGCQVGNIQGMTGVMRVSCGWFTLAWWRRQGCRMRWGRRFSRNWPLCWQDWQRRWETSISWDVLWWRRLRSSWSMQQGSPWRVRRRQGFSCCAPPGAYGGIFASLVGCGSSWSMRYSWNVRWLCSSWNVLQWASLGRISLQSGCLGRSSLQSRPPGWSSQLPTRWLTGRGNNSSSQSYRRHGKIPATHRSFRTLVWFGYHAPRPITDPIHAGPFSVQPWRWRQSGT